MTLIVGINLSDRIYLAGDTRVTQYDLQNGGYRFIDNIIKISPMYGKNVINSGLPMCKSSNLISVAIAGDVSLANFVYSKIKSDIFQGGLSNDIRTLFDQLDFEYLNKIADQWLSNGKEYDLSCCLIFGGNEHSRNKNISIQRLKMMVEQYKKEHKVDDKKRQEFEDILKEDKIMQIINEKMMQQAGKSVLQSIEESSIPSIPSFIEKAVQQNKETLSDFPDSLVFCVELKITKDGLIYNKRKAEWGQYLARGSEGINEGDLPDDLLSFIELMPDKEKSLEHLTEGVVITKTILDIAKKRNISTIGGSVVINCIKKDQSQIMSKNCKFVDDKIFIEVMGQTIPAISFGQFLKLIGKGTRAEF